VVDFKFEFGEPKMASAIEQISLEAPLKRLITGPAGRYCGHRLIGEKREVLAEAMVECPLGVL
jgi:hypothetical protein